MLRHHWFDLLWICSATSCRPTTNRIDGLGATIDEQRKLVANASLRQRQQYFLQRTFFIRLHARSVFLQGFVRPTRLYCRKRR